MFHLRFGGGAHAVDACVVSDDGTSTRQSVVPPPHDGVDSDELVGWTDDTISGMLADGH